MKYLLLWIHLGIFYSERGSRKLIFLLDIPSQHSDYFLRASDIANALMSLAVYFAPKLLKRYTYKCFDKDAGWVY